MLKIEKEIYFGDGLDDLCVDIHLLVISRDEEDGIVELTPAFKPNREDEQHLHQDSLKSTINHTRDIVNRETGFSHACR